MSAAAARQSQPSPAGLDDAVVAAAEIVAGHDGAAELMVRLRHGNGVLSSVTLDPETGFDLLHAAGAASLGDLVGLAWSPIIKRL
ncbi:MAG TPA: hypothetical protein VGI95_18970 [Caulobacteraceae bacterium]|jgi:hypothetical protein